MISESTPAFYTSMLLTRHSLAASLQRHLKLDRILLQNDVQGVGAAIYRLESLILHHSHTPNDTHSNGGS